jgi:hypothetical protein
MFSRTIVKNLPSFVLALAASLAVGTDSGPAQAAVGSRTGCSISMISYDTSDRLILVCSSGTFTTFYSFNFAPGCVTDSIDRIKIYLSMLQSAMLSGRTVDIVFNPPNETCGVATINTLQMR